MQLNIKTRAFNFFLGTVLATLLCTFESKAQLITPASYTSTAKMNYIRVWDVSAPLASENDIDTKGLKDVKVKTDYFDGLGKPIQTVMKQGSLATVGSATDQVSTVLYDQQGRQKYKHLTYGEATVDNGLFKLNPFSSQVIFYNNQLSGQLGETNVGPNNLNWAYTQTNFEASPLNRAEEAFAPGLNWVGSSGNTPESARRSVKMKYWNNTGLDAVRIWNVTSQGTGSFGTYATGGIYAAGELDKNVTVDERNKQVIEFKDKEGKVILKKVQVAAVSDNGSGTDHNPDNWACTYYIYDQFNNLRAVLQPEAVKWLAANNWNLNEGSPNGAIISSILKEQCFRYEYDQRNRMIMKKVPGAAAVYMIYDNRDRMILTQTGTMSEFSFSGDNTMHAQWQYTEYDQLNRPCRTSLIALSGVTGYVAGPALLAVNFNATFYGEAIQNISTYFGGYGYTIADEYGPWILTETFYDNYNWAVAAGMSAQIPAGDIAYSSSEFIQPS
ncbi:MAG: hypothetical protein H7Y86_21710, partial [Rhizobacter sp.]|nr:hypothetical protein [Ferruginibacter sp.]